MSAQDDDSPQVEDGEVIIKTPPDIAVDAIDNPNGLTAGGVVTLDLRDGSITIPQAKGVSWGYGDTPCGFGLDILLPGGTVVCLDEAAREVEVRRISPADRDLLDEILASIPTYRVRPSSLTGEVP